MDAQHQIVLAVIPTVRRPLERLESLTTALSAAGVNPIVLANSATSAELLEPTAIDHVVTGQNDGFSQSINIGARLREDWDWLLLCNDDVMVEPTALARTMTATLRDTSAGIVYLDPEQPRQIPGGLATWLSLSLTGAVVARILGTGRQASIGTASSRGEYRSFSAVAISRTTWSIAGPLDDRMRFTFEDVDYARRCRDLGIQTEAVPASGVVHEHSASGSGLISAVLPVSAWAGVEYLAKWEMPRAAARALVATALLARIPLVPAVKARKRAHCLGIARALRAVLSDKEPRLPRFEDL